MKNSHLRINYVPVLALMAVVLIVLFSFSRQRTGTASTDTAARDTHGAALKSNKSAETMEPNELQYIPDVNGKYWTNGGKTFIIEGAFYNLSSEFDVVELEDCVINLVDRDENLVLSVNVNEAAVGMIPHNDCVHYNISIKSIPGGSAAYAATDLLVRMETSFNYAPHAASDCPYCHNISIYSPTTGTGSGKPTQTCGWCFGEGVVKCRACKGTGKNDIYDLVSSPIMKGMMKPYCEACEGKGYIVCGRCHGSGVE